MKYLVFFILTVFIISGTFMYSTNVQSICLGTQMNEEHHPDEGDINPETEKLTAYVQKHVHFTDEFSEKQYYILHYSLHNDGYTSRVELPPEL